MIFTSRFPEEDEERRIPAQIWPGLAISGNVLEDKGDEIAQYLCPLEFPLP